MTGGEGFWRRPRRRDPRIPWAGCKNRANEGPRQKTRGAPFRNFKTGSKQSPDQDPPREQRVLRSFFNERIHSFPFSAYSVYSVVKKIPSAFPLAPFALFNFATPRHSTFLLLRTPPDRGYVRLASTRSVLNAPNGDYQSSADSNVA
jgi:hypothetical protein